jgi:hypothetical protein
MLSVSNKPIMLSVNLLSVIMLSVIMLSVIMLRVIMLSVIMLNVFWCLKIMLTLKQKEFKTSNDHLKSKLKH